MCLLCSIAEHLAEVAKTDTARLFLFNISPEIISMELLCADTFQSNLCTKFLS